ncbi:MAG: ester cyclase, partial [Caldilineaceae bacterium]|nr:ester cyclase [Caldilineaceae bacterium]
SEKDPWFLQPETLSEHLYILHGLLPILVDFFVGFFVDNHRDKSIARDIMHNNDNGNHVSITPAKQRLWVQQLIDEVWNGGNLATLEAFYAATILRRQPPFPPVEGLTAYRAFLTDTFATFANLHMVADEIICEGDTVVLLGTWSAAQTGPLVWANLPATGKSFKVAYCTVLHLQDSKVVEELVYVDQLGLLQQLRSN